MVTSPEARRKLWPSVGFVAAVLLAVEGGLIGVTHGWARVWWVIGAAATAGVQALAAARDRRSRDDALTEAEKAIGEERARTSLALSDSLMPLLRVLTLINEEPDPIERHALEEGALQSIVAAVASSIGPANARSCYFRMIWAQDERPDELVFVTAHGRADQPHSKFVAGTPLGDKIFTMVREDGYEFCPDLDTDPPEAWEDHPHEYRTFISVPVRTDKVVHGVLTVDAPEPGQLDDERDRPLLSVLARVLAATRPFDDAAAGRTAAFVRQ